VIRATVGDTIRVTFKNGVPHNATLHPHGVFYLKDAEGAPYNDGTSGARAPCAPGAVLLGLCAEVTRCRGEEARRRGAVVRDLRQHTCVPESRRSRSGGACARGRQQTGSEQEPWLAALAQTPAARAGDDKKDDVIPPGSSWTFVWQVNERAAPGPADPSSLMYMYHSHFDEVADVNAGLTGAIIVSRKARPRAPAPPRHQNVTV